MTGRGAVCTFVCVCVVIKCIPLRGVELGAAKTATSEIAAVWTYHHLCSWWLAGSEESSPTLRIPATTESMLGSCQTQLKLLSSKCLVWVSVIWKRLLVVMNPLKWSPFSAAPLSSMQHFNLLQLFVLFFTACSFNLSRQLFSEEPSIPHWTLPAQHQVTNRLS